MVRQAVHRPVNSRVSSPRPAPQLRRPTSRIAAPPQLVVDPRRHGAGLRVGARRGVERRAVHPRAASARPYASPRAVSFSAGRADTGRARHGLRRAPSPGRARVRRVRLLRRLHNLRLPDLSDLPLRPRRVPPWPVRARNGPRLRVNPLHGSRRVPTQRGDRPGDQRVQPGSGRDRTPRRRDGVDGCLEGYGTHANCGRASHSCRPNASLPIGGGVR